MRKLISKLRYFLALAIIALTISNVTLLSNQFKPSEGITASSNSGNWYFESR
ncbi:hypothetical protein Ana3638_07000 [Anaerocolumna sedimenticola]|uniref:Uncharacterized protein n=1 Tax=Anaerocolumna sedimenticola TaxID=2696063 RepID=A0A6P1TKW0_9FIRM|nr:hypothetical protein [Anaerocolumna sedimenticola]QHQ60546.1 hypothetical protein Ana3638_07000 [Anaerocolumna sedimenticola]